MVCVGLSERDLKILGGSGPPGTPLAPPLSDNMWAWRDVHRIKIASRIMKGEYGGPRPLAL